MNSKKQSGKGWNQSNSQPTNDICFDKQGEIGKRKVIPSTKEPSFHLECFNLEPNDSCYKNIQKKIGAKGNTTKEFQLEQCNQSVDPLSPCYLKTPCGINQMKHKTGCLSEKHIVSSYVSMRKPYSDILGKTQWIQHYKGNKQMGSEIELFVKD